VPPGIPAVVAGVRAGSVAPAGATPGPADAAGLAPAGATCCWLAGMCSPAAGLVFPVAGALAAALPRPASATASAVWAPSSWTLFAVAGAALPLMPWNASAGPMVLKLVVFTPPPPLCPTTGTPRLRTGRLSSHSVGGLGLGFRAVVRIGGCDSAVDALECVGWADGVEAGDVHPAATVVPNDGHPEVVDWWLEQLQRGLQVRAHKPCHFFAFHQGSRTRGSSVGCGHLRCDFQKLLQILLPNERKLSCRFRHQRRVCRNGSAPLRKVLKRIACFVEGTAFVPRP